MRRFNVASAALVLLSIVTGNVVGGATYTITDLGTLGGIYTKSSAFGINDSGQVVGLSASANSSVYRAFLYSGSTMTDLGTLAEGTISQAYGINNSGQVVGISWTAGTTGGHAFLYSGSAMTDLGTGGGVLSLANAINNSGQIVGTVRESDGCNHGFLYDGSQMIELPALGGIYERGTAEDINDSGQIVGYAYSTDGTRGRAFLYSGSTMTDLGTLGGTNSSAYGINNSGQVVGLAYTADPSYHYHAFLYSGSTMTDLGTLGGRYTFASRASDINDSGQIVGWSMADYFDNRAFLYSNAAMTDLNTLIDPSSGWTLLTASAINNFGCIAGAGINPAGEQHAFLLTPTTPSVTNVTATNPDGTYGVGSIIGVEIVFDQPVTVTGMPLLTMGTIPLRAVHYASGSGTDTLLFNYTVQPGDAAADLDYCSSMALALAGGAIQNAAGNSAVLALPPPGTAGSLSYNKDITIDGVAPVVSNVTATNANGSYRPGSVIGIQVVFDGVVHVTGTPRLSMRTTPLRVVDYASGSGTSTLLFNYTVQPGDTAADLDHASSTALNPAGGAIRDAAGNSAVLVLPPPGSAGSLSYNKDITIDGVAPVVSNVTAVEPDGVYGLGSTIRVQVIFGEAVIVTGAPQLMLNAGSGRTADYASGSGSTTLQFEYTVQAGDAVERLDYTATAALVLNGGTIRDAVHNDANLTLPAPGTPGSLGYDRNIVIDAAGPEAVEWYSARDHGADTVLIPLNPSPGGDGATVEPRLGGLQRIYVGFTRGIEMINPAGVVVTGHSTAGGVLQGAVDYSGSATLSVPDPYYLQIDFPVPPSPAALPDQTCYTIAMAGAVRGDNGVALTGVTTLHVRVLCGDTTGNGRVNLGDALMIRNGINTRGIWDAPGLDLNCDGVIDNADMLLCKQKVTSPPAAAQCP